MREVIEDRSVPPNNDSAEYCVCDGTGVVPCAECSGRGCFECDYTGLAWCECYASHPIGRPWPMKLESVDAGLLENARNIREAILAETIANEPGLCAALDRACVMLALADERNGELMRQCAALRAELEAHRGAVKVLNDEWNRAMSANIG